MIVQDCYTHIKIGLTLRLLRNLGIKDKKEIVIECIDELKKDLEYCGFEVSIAGITSISFYKMEQEVNALEDGNDIGDILRNKLETEFATLESIVFAEALTKKIYVIPKRRFNSDYLMSQPDKLFKEGVYTKLSELARHDIASSCRCLLLGEATASAFHILRATEEVLKSYYLVHRKQKRLKNPMWGPMVDQLEAKKKNPPPETLLRSLDLIRTAYRNPTQHPESIYEIDGAQDLFGVCLDVLSKMAEEL